MPDQLFPLGRVMMTTNLQGRVQEANPEHWEEELKALIARHASGDWGNLEDFDRQQNDRALHQGSGRLFSTYTISSGIKLYVITEADRSCTTALSPKDY